MNLCDMKTIKQIMAMFSLNFKKEFGQNFLTDNLVVEDIADMCCDFTAKTILEVGPGIGPLTQELAKRYENVVVSAMQLPDGSIVTGRSSRRMVATAAMVLNAIKKLAGI